MRIFNFLRKNKDSAKVAKERLQIIISHERAQRDNPDYLIELQNEILDVIAKYIKIDRDKITVQVDRVGDSSMLELNVTMPEHNVAEA